jgi:hypothetical protein
MEDLKDSLQENATFYRRQVKLIAARLAILPKGTIKPKKIGRKIFYYLQYRQGKAVKSDYVGKLVPLDLREKLDERKRLEKELGQVRDALKLLKAKAGNETDLVEPLRSILAKLTREKLWDSGFEIIGSWCFLLYQRLLPIEKYPLKTQDLDILIPLPYRGRPFDLNDFFKNLGFSQNFNPDGSIYFSGHKMKIEFLGPEKGDGRKPPRYINEITITPQLLHYLDILFEEPLVLKVAKGIKAKVPAPAAFTLHKLIIATLFKRASKKEKDIRQAVYAGKYVLSERSEMNKMLRLWERLPRPWKRKVGRALADALEIVPLEQGVIRRLQSLLK